MFFSSLGACSEEVDEAAIEPEEQSVILAQVEAQALEGQGAAPEPTAELEPETVEPLVLISGFIPDPKIIRGEAGGGVDAHGINPACAGWIERAPDHLLTAPVAFTELRILATADADITLVVQKPDGTFLCNDDARGAGTNPQVKDFFPAGDYSIWVGAATEGASVRYHLGFTELPARQVDHERVARGH